MSPTFLEPSSQWSGLTADHINAGANVGLLFTAIITAYLALQSMRQARDIEKRSNRPMMIAEIVPPSTEYEEVGLRISNVGRSVARNVQVEFDPPLPEPDLDRLNSESASLYNFTNIERLRMIFEDRIFETWTPGMEVTAAYWAVPNGLEVNQALEESAEGVPAEQRVVIEFKDEGGENYTDTFTLDVHMILGLRFSDSELTKMRKSTEKIARTGENLIGSAEKIAQYIRYSSEELEQAERDRRAKIERIRRRWQNAGD